MEYATIFVIIFSLHSSCLGAIQDGYIPPGGGGSNDVCPCDGQKKNIMFDMSTIQITVTEQLPPIMETKFLPPVTSYMTIPVVDETQTVIETIEQFITTTHFTPLPVTIFTPQPMMTILSPYSVTSTSIKEPVTKTLTQEITKFASPKALTSTLMVTSTVTQESVMHVISFTPVTNTETVPLAINFITSHITVTEALPAVIRTVSFGSIKTLQPRTVIVTPPPVTLHTPPHIEFETIGITHTSVARPVTKFREHTIFKTNANCKSNDYNYDEPTKAFDFKTPTVEFTHGSN